MTEIKVLQACALPYRRALSAGVALMLCESGAALVIPGLGGRVTELFLQERTNSTSNTQMLFYGILSLFAAQALLKFGNTYLLGRTADRVVADLKIRLYDHLQALPVSFFHRRRQGDTLALLTHDVYVVSGYVSGTLLAVAPLVFTVCGALVLMFRINPLLATLSAIMIPPFYFLIKVIGRRIRPLAQQLQEEHAKAIAIAEENLGMLPAIKSFTREQQEAQRYRAQVEQIVRLSTRERRIYASLGPGIQFVAASGVVLILWLAQREIGDGGLTASELVSFLLYGQLMTRPIAGLADLYGQTQRARGALARLAKVLSEEPEAAWHTGIRMPKILGNIEFRGVTFAYPGRPPALKRLNLSIAAGETVAIIGANGAGKSTLGHLLMRLYEPSEGSVLIDGIDVSNVSLQSLRSQVGIVPQHVLLFNGTIRENIAYGRPEPTQEEVEGAAKSARAHDFILKLPEGYDTLIGDRGVRLSGGQQQRLALARALLKSPPILILDEATAMFDPEGEREFLEVCRDVLRDRTVLLITHRPASLSLADRVMRLDDGVLR